MTNEPFLSVPKATMLEILTTAVPGRWRVTEGQEHELDRRYDIEKDDFREGTSALYALVREDEGKIPSGVEFVMVRADGRQVVVVRTLVDLMEWESHDGI